MASISSFRKDCLLFGKREPYFITLGVAGWLSIIGIVTIITVTTILIL